MARRSVLATRLLCWYGQNARDLPWRRDRNPYRIWISEVMLQQTRVETVIPYYQRWLSRFPDVRSLARAREITVLRLWEGLGYYSRARNLHRAARSVVSDFEGTIPSDVDALRRLPGVGEYIAAAVASIAFGRDVVALDGNARRVLARLALIRLPIDSSAGASRLSRFAQRHLPRGRASDFNQALMDLGATICVSPTPRCAACPLSRVCKSRRLGVESRIPVRRARAPIPQYHVRALVLRCRGAVLMQRRPPRGLLGGLWEFPKSSRRSAVPTVAHALRDLGLAKAAAKARGRSKVTVLTTLNHAYSHFHVRVIASSLMVRMPHRSAGMHWIRMERLGKLPMGKVDRVIASAVMTDASTDGRASHRSA